ncbi:hypothetical protein D1646_10075 [Pseudoflavonifractor sp. 60]|uniref:nitroreductase family protein n=1 Tax=Pseudoflavonifractor sp. 60 TaxID=2304576 RepID=UPI00136BC2CD|nr:nitroreductase family protein [Pseudoflavonifractor sp. 60]NBI67158.1 hypothetical protein [Pseudoflavonifractor sp. 60]
MEFYEVIKKRKTSREWADKEVDFEAVKQIIDAGLAAPTHNHLREWEFIVLHEQAEKENCMQFAKKWAEEHGLTDPNRLFPDASVMQRMYQYAMPRQYTMLVAAPYIIVPLFKLYSLRSNYVDQLNAFSSIWCVVENMFLAATAEGLGTSMRIPVGDEGAKVCKALGVPEGWMMPCYIGIGYPREDAPEVEQLTFSADQKMHMGKW